MVIVTVWLTLQTIELVDMPEEKSKKMSKFTTFQEKSLRSNYSCSVLDSILKLCLYEIHTWIFWNASSVT